MAQSLNILVTGGAGYLGSILVPELLRAGHRVAVLDRFMYERNSLATVCADPNFTIVDGDARLEPTLKPLVAKADVVIPLAALVGAPLCDRDPITATSTNFDAVVLLTKLMSPAQRLIIPVSNSGYGVGEAGKHCTEDSPLRPISRYGRDKVAAEKAALERENAMSFRFATVFGVSPRMRVDLLVNDFVYRAVHDRAVVLFESHFKRNYLHVSDTARAFLHGINNFDAMKGGPYNVGLSDANLSKWQLCERIQAQVPGFTFIEAPIGEDPDKRDYIVSNAKIEGAGFLPRHSLDEGIGELIKGYRMFRRTEFSNV
ncbi:MAG: NAD-dependent epimerase/dehydratase family protein [Rhodospirillales bacterium]|nr:NAD-dependent epimerase/dehydratase family protein [Rhodospirillales bacterium]